ncbi:hypothetical protein CEE45_11120 [Candidatus Heimdallarchaeota archaeon B3_Heim]|nr:MAG: hypothetical protein CEE45_11120 [Candidatus Heimdallarchaeota archaeon B3_Heim]
MAHHVGVRFPAPALPLLAINSPNWWKFLFIPHVAYIFLKLRIFETFSVVLIATLNDCYFSQISRFVENSDLQCYCKEINSSSLKLNMERKSSRTTVRKQL